MKWVEKFKPYQHQIDEVGNILQLSGAVKPAACQKCKKKFNAKTEAVEIKKKVPWFKCNKCEFGAPSIEDVYFHTQDTDDTHTVNKTFKYRIVDIEYHSKGRVAIITTSEDECHIICSDCNGS